MRLGTATADVRSFKHGVTIDVAGSEAARTRAVRLIKERYAWRGYGSDVTLEHHPDRVSLVATDQGSGATIGTLTVGMDGSGGLAAERVYPTEIQHLRAKGRRLGEITKFAIGHAKTSHKPLLGELFHMAFIQAYYVQRRTDLVIEVTPKHARFYHDMLHFEVAGGERFNPRVSTYGVLLRLNLRYAAQQIARLGGRAGSVRERSLYAYAMSPVEHQTMLGELAEQTPLAAAA